MNQTVGLDWSVLAELAAKTEFARRRILGSHVEAGTTEETGDADFRDRLDRALDRLMLIELGIETVQFTFEESGVRDIAGLSELLQSDAFIRFLNSYLYFGVRFLARRLSDVAPSLIPGDETNALPAGLIFPPEIRREAYTDRAVPDYLFEPAAPDISAALAFLDDYVTRNGEPLHFELWLRGLGFGVTTDNGGQFPEIARGMVAWIRQRVEFYSALEGIDPNSPLLRGEWLARNPLSARFAVVDLYWLARLLRADVTAVASVTYQHHSWFNTLAIRAGSDPALASPEELRKAEKILRAVFGFACDLIQNSVELSEADYCHEHAREHIPKRPATTVNWRAACDDELLEVAAQREIRTFSGGIVTEPGAADVTDGRGWSRRIRTGQHPGNLTGLAVSGGGIRSATFNLGIFQGLQELDLLRHIDFLSTVSGGGYIGGWLVGNVSRTPFWLGRLTDWRKSIAHLRSYSDYLAPQSGLLSADSWTMGGIWFRNTLLIQMTAITWLALILTLARIMKVLFDWAGWGGAQVFSIAILAAICFLCAGALYNLRPANPLAGVDGRAKKNRSHFSPWGQQGVVVGVALPAWIAAFCSAAWMWSQAAGQAAQNDILLVPQRFATIAMFSLDAWKVPLSAMFAVFAVLAAYTVRHRRFIFTVIGSLVTATLCVAALFLMLCGVEWLFARWAENPGHYGWDAYVFGAPLVMLSVSMAVILFNGLCGRNAAGWINEWWSRTGSWLGILGLVFLATGIAAILGPRGILALFKLSSTLSWGAIAGWAATTIGGLLAGNSPRTSGRGGSGRARALDTLARAAGFVFVGGSVVAVAFALHEVLTAIGADPFVTNYWQTLNSLDVVFLSRVAAALACFGVIFAFRFDLNTFGLNEFYRNRLVRCYLGATRWRPGWRNPRRFTGFDDADDIPMYALRTMGKPLDTAFRGPFPIINCTLNLGGSSDLSLHTRRSAPFTITPLHCGADRSRVGYAPAEGFAGGLTLGRAMSVSGAAASPNSGYSTSSLASLLLTMFNVRLGWWFPNPGRAGWAGDGVGRFLLFRELFGLADENGKYVNVSDGGHFENLGVYELVRRRCRVIIASDAECDPNLDFGSLGNLVRICETDFGAKIELDVASVRKDGPDELSHAHCAVGTITYSNGDRGCLIYLKAALTGDEDVGIAQYKAVHPAFPHESTENQFFSENQFESYRRLGYHIVKHAFRGVGPGELPSEIGDRLLDIWAPAGPGKGSYETFVKSLDELRERFRSSPDLSRLFSELNESSIAGDSMTGTEKPEPNTEATQAEICACLELTQFMENIFIGIRLDDYWEHPNNRGWAMLFTGWARSPLFRAVWSRNIRKFGISFEYFCSERLGLPSVRPVARV